MVRYALTGYIIVKVVSDFGMNIPAVFLGIITTRLSITFSAMLTYKVPGKEG
jgi:hypothetical protein